MEQSYAISAWFFTRALCAVYLIAFLSLMVQAKGLWGKQGIMPIAEYHKAVAAESDHFRYNEIPSAFWLSSSDEFIYGAAVTGACFAFAALAGFAQGWSLLICFGLYLSFCSSGQSFMTFQWDALLLEVGFLALFTVPWNFNFSVLWAHEPHWLVRGMFYVVLFKLMFLSGVVKLTSGDESWRDLTALSYHYWTQPLPNPLSPFMNALPLWIHQVSAVLTFIVELIVPFFFFWPRARFWAALPVIGLSLLIFVTGNYTFFNILTIALCFWLIPDEAWRALTQYLPFELQTAPAHIFPHPTTAVAMLFLGFLSVFWILRPWLPEQIIDSLSPFIANVQPFHISSPYGLFANMTKERREIVIEGSSDGREWKEYEFKYKPGDVNRMPPIVEPHQPRLDWQMWFAALGNLRSNPWMQTLMLRLFQNAPDVTELFEKNPFSDKPPMFLRARLYEYTFADPEDIVNSGIWWRRKPVGDYSPAFQNKP